MIFANKNTNKSTMIKHFLAPYSLTLWPKIFIKSPMRNRTIMSIVPKNPTL